MNPTDFNFVFDLVSNFGAIGFMFWLAWRTTNRTIPRIVRTGEEHAKSQREDFLRESKIMREDFMHVMKEQRDFFREQIERERDISQVQTKQIVEALKDLKMEIRSSGVV